MMKNCVVCDAEFERKSHSQILCTSRKCHSARKRTNEKKRRSRRNSTYPFKMRRQCACGVIQIKTIHSEQERLAPFECKSCIDASTNYKWHEMQLLYLVMINGQCKARDFVRQGVFKDLDEYVDFYKFLRDVMQINPHHKVDRTGGWSWGSLAKEHSIVKHKGTSVHGQSELSTLKDYLQGILDRNKKSLEEE